MASPRLRLPFINLIALLGLKMTIREESLDRLIILLASSFKFVLTLFCAANTERIH